MNLRKRADALDSAYDDEILRKDFDDKIAAVFPEIHSD